MNKLSFEVPLGKPGLHNMAEQAKEIRDTYNSKRNPNEWTAWHMLYTACMDLRKKLR